MDNVPTDVTPTVGLRVNHYVVCETDSPEGPVVFRARILSADKDELMLCREKEDCHRANLEAGVKVSITYHSEDGRSHIIRAPVSASSGSASPWFSIRMEEARGSLDAGQKKAEAPKEEPEFQFRALPKAPLPGTILTDEPLRKGRIIKLDSRGMVMRTEDNIPRGKYIVQDLQCKGVVAGLELQGAVIKCRSRDIHLFARCNSRSCLHRRAELSNRWASSCIPRYLNKSERPRTNESESGRETRVYVASAFARPGGHRRARS